jgi:hypothetical protein
LGSNPSCFSIVTHMMIAEWFSADKGTIAATT